MKGCRNLVLQDNLTFKGTFMNELIRLNETNIGDETVQTVNARELHGFLEVGKDFSTWIKNRLETLGSIENEDYLVVQEVFPKMGEKGGRPKTEYYLTLDVAKHLAMMEKNEKGKEVRDYFIECEKQLRQVVLSVKDQCFLDIVKAETQEGILLGLNKLNNEVIVPLENKVVEQREQIVVLQPKGQFYDAVIQSETLLDLSEVSKLLNYKGLGRNNLFRYLRENGILNNKNLPYQTYVDRGYFKIVESSWVNPSTKLVEVSLKTVMFQKGIDWLDKLLSECFDKNKD